MKIDFHWNPLPDEKARKSIEKEISESVEEHWKEDVSPCHGDILSISLGLERYLDYTLNGSIKCSSCGKALYVLNGYVEVIDDNVNLPKLTLTSCSDKDR